MAYQNLLYTVANGVATVTLNRPDRLNALNRELLLELRDAVRLAAGDSAVRCLLLTGAGRAFCSGADLSARAAGGTNDPRRTLRELYLPVLEALAAMDKPMVAAVNGPCAGAGMSLAIAADIVVAGRSAYFLQAFVNIGLVPDAGATWVLPRLIGQARAAGMALLGERLSADKAAEWGLVWQCVEDDQLLPVASGIAAKLGQGPTKTMGLIRRALRDGWRNDLLDQVVLEADLQWAAAQTADHKEGVTAFMEKRAARFTGT